MCIPMVHSRKARLLVATYPERSGTFEGPYHLFFIYLDVNNKFNDK